MRTTTTRGRRARPLPTLLLLGCVAAIALGSLSGCGTSKAKSHGAAPTATKTVKQGWNVVISPAVGTEGDLRAVSALSAASAWAVGQYEGTDGVQHTLAERWDGSQWSVAASPSPGQDSNLLSAVSADSMNDAWAVGTQMDTSNTRQPLIEHWNGSTWSVVAGSDMGHQESWLSGVAAIGPNDVWAVGTLQRSATNGQPSSVPLVEHWQGSAWTVAPQPAFSSPDGTSPVDASLNAVTALSANNAWAVGMNGPQAIIEHWDGTRWNTVANPTLPPATDGNSLVSISADAANDIWAVGIGPLSVSHSCAGAPGPLIEHWDGTQWSVVTPASPPNAPNATFSFSGVVAVSPSNAWIVGGQETYDAANGAQVVPLIEHWDGTQWSVAPVGTVNTAYGLMGVAASGGTAFTVGQHQDANGGGPTLVEQLSVGGSWSLVASPNPGTVDNRLNAVAGVSASDIWAVGESGDGALAEHWNGSDWSVVSAPNGGSFDDSLSAVTTISASDAWAVGSASNTSGLIEHWNGAQWSLSQGVSDASGLTAVAAVSSTSVYVTGSGQGGPLAQHWNGSAWSALPALAPLPQNTLQYENLLGIAALADNNVWVVGGTVGHSCGGLLPALIEHWDGARWTAAPNVPNGALTAISATGPNDIWAAGNMGGNQSIMHYDGQSWSLMSLPFPTNRAPQISGVSARAPNDVWVVGVGYSDQGEAAVAFHWDGKAWTQTTVTPPRNGSNAFYGVATIGASNVWAVGYFNGCSVLGDQQALIERHG